MSENLKICPFFMQKKYAEKNGLCVLPLPCVRDEHGEIKKQAIKQIIAKIDEELNELKNAVLLIMPTEIAEEAADVITAITTLEEALGIDAEMRDEAQRRVNEKNRNRGRLDD